MLFRFSLIWKSEFVTSSSTSPCSPCLTSLSIRNCVLFGYYKLYWFILVGWFSWVIVFNATFNNISVISWRSVLLVEEAGVIRRKPSTCRKSLTNFITYMLYRVHLAMNGVWFEITTIVVIDTDCTGNCKSNYHTVVGIPCYVFILLRLTITMLFICWSILL